MKKIALVSISLLVIFSFASCRSAQPGPMAMAMLHPISGSQAVGNGHGNLDRPSPRNCSVGNSAAQRFPFEQFHDGEGLAVLGFVMSRLVPFFAAANPERGAKQYVRPAEDPALSKLSPGMWRNPHGRVG